jgi:hypothetical protein
MFSQANKSHPAKHDVIWEVGGGWAMSLAKYWAANTSSPQSSCWNATTQTTGGGRPGAGLPRPGPVGLARPAAARVANAPQVSFPINRDPSPHSKTHKRRALKKRSTATTIVRK